MKKLILLTGIFLFYLSGNAQLDPRNNNPSNTDNPTYIGTDHCSSLILKTSNIPRMFLSRDHAHVGIGTGTKVPGAVLDLSVQTGTPLCCNDCLAWPEAHPMLKISRGELPGFITSLTREGVIQMQQRSMADLSVSGYNSSITFEKTGHIYLNVPSGEVTISSEGDVTVGRGRSHVKLYASGLMEAQNAQINNLLTTPNAQINNLLTAQNVNINGLLKIQSIDISSSIKAQSADISGLLKAQSADISSSLKAQSADISSSLKAQSANISGTVTANAVNAQTSNITGTVTANALSVQSAKINGLVCAKEIRVLLSGAPCWPDFVFGNDYHLLPLRDVEQFIAENQHLPNVPSAAEVETNGVNVGEMNAILLQKVEELTLYLIQLQKQVDELKQSKK